MGINFYRAVKTNQNPKSRNRQHVVQSNQPPPAPVVPVVVPVNPITIEQFLYYDADRNGVLTQSEITSNPTGNFDLIKAAELMRFSIFAYDQYDAFKLNDVDTWEIPPPFDTLYKNPVTVINAIYENVADAFSASDPISKPSIPLGFITESIASNYIFVNWRGTGNTAEWKQDAKFNQTPCSFLPQVPQKEMVHLGFQELYTTTNDSGISPQNTVMNYLNAVTQKQDKIVHVTGHSLGGGLAVLNTCDILENISGFKSVIMYSFAGPRVGDVDFVDTFNTKTLINGTPGCWRVVNDYDLVPMLPTEEQGYKHVNGLYSIKFGNKLTPTNLADIPLNHSHLTYFVTLVQELRNNKYTAAYLKSKGFTATELKSGGYTRIELQAAGFTDAVLNALPW
jgi:hypothetical protein